MFVRRRGDDRGVSVTAAELELLQRHAPLLLLDPLERWAPVPVDAFLAASAVVADDHVVASPPARIDRSVGAAGTGMRGASAGGAGASAGGAGTGGASGPRASRPGVRSAGGLAAADADSARETSLHLDPVRGVAGGPPRAAAMFARFAPPPAPAQWRCYGTVQPLAGGARALVYWFFYADNPFGIWFTDVGRHVGDWEQVQVELDAAGVLAAVTVYQHGSAHRVAAGSTDLTRTADGRPRVYVAEGSHAAYLTPGSQPRKLKRDNTGDGGRSGVPQVLPLPAAAGSWPRWPGRWGPDTGPVVRAPRWLLALVRRLAGGGLGGDSPPGPLARGPRRTSTPPATPAPAAPPPPAASPAPPSPPAAPPEELRSSAPHRGVQTTGVPAPPAHTPGRFAPNAWLSRLLRRLGAATWPRELTLERAVVEDGRVRIRLRTGGAGLRRARYADALVVDRDGAALGHARARVRGGVAELLVAPVSPGTPAEARAAVYNRLDQRSDLRTAPLG